MKELNEIVFNGAKLKGICEPWEKKIAKAASIDRLLSLYQKGIDFCIEKDFPTKEFLKEKGGEKLKGYGIRIDEVVNEINPEWMIFLGICRFDLDLKDYMVSSLFIRHNSRGIIKASGNAIITIDCFDLSFFKVEATDQAKVLINIYGNSKVKTEMSGAATIKVINKLKQTY